MKINFKKISAIASSVLLTGMTMGVAAAANYPAPFVQSGTANVAVVYGTGAGVSSLDIIQAGNIQTSLQSSMGSASESASTATVSGGDSVTIENGRAKINLGDTWSVFGSGVSVGSDDLKTLLADGTYIAYDNDEFDYEQSIILGTPDFEHFRDSDYEDEVGLSSKTPTLGFQMNSNTWILNYTMDFTSDAESDLVSDRMDDIEKSNIYLLGKKYYVSELQNGTSATKLAGKLSLLDSANSGIVTEGETVSMTIDGKKYDVSLSSLTTTQAKFIVNGETTTSLTEGSSFKLSDGAYVGVTDIYQRDVSGVVGNVEFSLGKGKLEFPSGGAEVKLNDVAVDGLKGWVYKGTASGSTEKLDKIVLEWKTDDELFLTEKAELLLPGFESVKFTMPKVVRNTEEKVTVEKDSDTSIELTVPSEKGDISFNIMYGNASGEFDGIGKSATERLATSPNATLIYHEKFNGNDFHKYFVISYNTTTDAESYLMRAKVSYDSTDARGEVDFERYDGSAWQTICSEKTNATTCSSGMGSASFTLDEIKFISGQNESITLKAGTDTNFATVFTKGGLKILLPYDIGLPTSLGGMGTDWNATMTGFGHNVPGEVNLGEWENATSKFSNASESTAGHSAVSYFLNMSQEDRSDNIAAGGSFYLTLDDTSNGNLQVSQLNGAGSGGSLGLEVADTSTYEAYINGSEVAPRVLHYTNPDEDYAEVYYPTGDSETYAQVFLAEAGAIASGTTTGGATQLGDVLVKDTEVASVSTKNLVIVGGSCINSAAATVLGGAYCGAAFTDKTGVGSGQFLIQSKGDAFSTGKIALVVAGYEAADTVNAATYLRTQTVDTTAGKTYKGTSSTSAALVVA